MTSAEPPAQIDPNQYQVAGDHYRASIQHWDLMIENQVPYLVGQATKYVTRVFRKNGAQDVEKAMHYVDKLLSSYEKGTIPLPTYRTVTSLDEFIEANGLGQLEHHIISLLLLHTTVKEIRAVLLLMEALHDRALLLDDRALLIGGKHE